MSRSRYEPVPQLEEAIDLCSYNYNSGVPNSPPPSFQSVELPAERCQTPRPHDRIPNTDAITTSREVLIVNLHRRVEKLEETIGRLLLEKETTAEEHRSPDRTNCCVAFPATDDSFTAERELLRGKSNCCVVVRSPKRRSDVQRKVLWGVGLLVLMTTWGLIALFWRRMAHCGGFGCDMKQ